ncbi:MAG TPA: hypothetical protein VMI54_31415 [Polyangiaceae bacterium]|nr:hypothetical protein [Polyangiaceae bacterium]
MFVAALLAAPRPTEPLVLPLPEPHRSTLERSRAEDRARVEQVRSRGLSFAARSVGEELRRFGAAVAHKSPDAPLLLATLRGLAKNELRDDAGRPLLALRAVQTELFVEATHAWERTGKLDDDLRELGGDFADLAQRSGWFSAQTLVLEDDERALLFRMRWNDLTGLGDKPPFADTQDELRDRYALLLRHPSGDTPAERARRQLGYVDAVEALDHDFPAMFARGVLLFRTEAYEASADAFRAHLAAHPDGPWTLRAKNHLLEALRRIPGED